MAGLIFGILAFFCCCKFLFGPLGIIFSLVGLSQINRHPEFYEGRGLAIAGLVLSILSLLLAVFLFMIALATGNFHFNWNFIVSDPNVARQIANRSAKNFTVASG